MKKRSHILRVFISYAREDKKIADNLYQRLMLEGVDVWLDTQSILPGQDWEVEIRNAVQNADVILICLSKVFNKAGYRQREVRIALAQASLQPEGEIFIIPVRIENCENLESLRRWQWVDLFESNGYELLVRALRTRAKSIDAVVPNYEEPKIAPKKTTSPYLSEMLSTKSGNHKLSKDKLDKKLGDKFLTVTLPAMATNKQIKSWGIILVDIDDMSLINKHYGNEVGDLVLETVALLTKINCTTEYFGRCGDDTFFMLVENVATERLPQISEGLRRDIEKHLWSEIANGLRVTASLGYAKFKSTEDVQSCIVRASNGFILAKSTGGNKTKKGPQFLAKKQSLNLRDYYS